MAAISETKKIDSSIIENLINSKVINLEEDGGARRLRKDEDLVKVDSNTLYSFVLQPERKGISRMSKLPTTGLFAHRRITVINLPPETVLRIAYNISVSGRIIYATGEDSLKAVAPLFCIDFTVPATDAGNLKKNFQNELNTHLPLKGESKKKVIPCYVLRPMEGRKILIKQSSKSGNEFGYNGLEFGGEGIVMKAFVGYLENELNYPVYDATGLTQYYDVEFHKNNTEPLQSIKEGLAKLGLELVKEQREMDVLVISGR